MKKPISAEAAAKIPVTMPMLCFVAYVSFILINDYLTYFKLFSAPLLGYGLAALVTFGAAFALRRFIQIEKTPINWVDIAVIAGCFALYALKASMPNHWYDSANYHIYLQEYPFADNVSRNYFPATAIQTFTYPLADRLSTPFRHILGYRLGTLPNPLLFIMIYFQTKRILAALLKERKFGGTLVSACSAVGFVSLQAYFILHVYNGDLWYVPLILEIVYLLLAGASGSAITVYLCWLGGLISSMKINNAMFIVLLAAVYIALNYKSLRIKSVLIGIAAFIFPIAVYALNVYLQTGNPVFPFYNNVFKSEFFALSTGLDTRWGPENVWQGLIWPVYGMFDTLRTSGMNFIDISLGAGYLFALARLFIAAYRYLVHKKRPEREKWLLPALIIGLHLINSFLMIGYWRYIIFLCPLSGALAAQTFLEIYQELKKKRPKKEQLAANRKYLLYAGIAAACVPFIVNLALTAYLALRTNHNQGYAAPITIAAAPHRRNAAYILRDQTSGVDESFTKDIKALAMAHETSSIPALLGMDETPLISVYPGTTSERQRALLQPYRDGGLYLMSIGEYSEFLLKYLNGSNYRLNGDIRRTRANFINCDDWLYAFGLEPLPSYDDVSAMEVLSANVLSERPSFEWKLPASGKCSFEAYLGQGINLPQMEKGFVEVIADVYLRGGGGEEAEPIASYTIAPGAMPSKIRLELDIPEGEYSLEFVVRRENGTLREAPWAVMLIQPELR